MSKLWSAIQSHYRPSAAYQVSVVLIEAKRPAGDRRCRCCRAGRSIRSRSAIAASSSTPTCCRRCRRCSTPSRRPDRRSRGSANRSTVTGVRLTGTGADGPARASSRHDADRGAGHAQRDGHGVHVDAAERCRRADDLRAGAVGSSALRLTPTGERTRARPTPSACRSPPIRSSPPTPRLGLAGGERRARRRTAGQSR